MNELDELVDAAEALHEETGRMVRGVRRWQRQCARGASMTEIVRSSHNRDVLASSADVSRTAAGLLARLRSNVIDQLSREGWTRRQLADLIGVTHQRISKIARPPDRDDRLMAGPG